MNFEPSFLMFYIVYLPLSSSPGMTISYFAMTLRGRGGGKGGGGPRLNVIVMLIFKKWFGSVPQAGVSSIKAIDGILE